MGTVRIPASTALSMAEIHEVLLDILREVMLACDRHGIEVCLIGGGCLGLARNGGFVPWDDDLDLAIWAGDIPAFLEAMKQLPDHLQVRAKPQEHNPTHQVIDMRTRISGAGEADGVGVFIDIVPMMHWRSPAAKRLDCLVAALMRTAARPGGSPVKNLVRKLLHILGVDSIAKRIATGFLYPWFARQDRSCRRHATGIVSGASGRCWAGRYPHGVVYPLRRTLFGGVPVFVPNDMHNFLVRRYGKTYMTPHDEKSRWRHFKSAVRQAQD